MRVYLASPFFNEKEMEPLKEAEQILEAKGLDVFHRGKTKWIIWRKGAGIGRLQHLPMIKVY